LHTTPQAPARQVARPLAGTAQASPQRPQWFASLAVSTQAVPQRASPVAQPLSQRPPRHTGAEPAQTVPQAPQERAAERSASQPLRASRSQSAKPGLQRNPQAPSSHTGAALAGVGHCVQAVPHWVALVSGAQASPQR
jgi:hypothetical protein